MKKNNYVVLINGGGANFASVKFALDRLSVRYLLTDDIKSIQSADKLIFPGVGNAEYAMQALKNKGLIDIIKNLKQPLLGICVGSQVLCASTEEGNVDCLNVIPLEVKLLKSKIIPQMGWNNLTDIKDNPLLKGITKDDNFYFVHSFAGEINKDWTIGACNYDIDFSAVVHKDNFYGVQFHPEKSGVSGEKILKNFMKL